MDVTQTAGVDWAGDGWLAVVFDDGQYKRSVHKEEFSQILTTNKPLNQVLVDVPIGLPEDSESLNAREELDSSARSFTGRPSSVFPVPSRNAARQAYQGEPYTEVRSQNQSDIDKGLNKQSYYIADAIGEVDLLLEENKMWRNTLVESHPEVCFRGLLGCELTYSKKCGPGVGERLKALANTIEAPGELLQTVTADLIGESDEIDLDDVLDAIALGVISTHTGDQLQYLPNSWTKDPQGLPMRMAFQEAGSAD